MNHGESSVLPLKIASEIVGYKPDTLRKKARAGIYPTSVIWKNRCGSWLVDTHEWQKWQRSHQ